MEARPSTRSTVSTAVIITALFLASTVTFVLNCSVRDLWEPEELRYSETAREMVDHGEYFVMHLNGLVYHEKPPLYFYSMALCTRVFGGFNVWAMRFPTALAGFGCCVLAFLLARHLYGQEAGMLSAVVLFTTPYFAMTTAEARMDVLLTFFIMLSLYWFCLAFTERYHEGRRLLGAWVCFALGTLTKGPIGLVLPLLTIVGYLLWRRNWRYLWTRKWWMLLGLVLFALIVSAWLAPACQQGGPEFTRNILFKQNIQRYTNAWDHEGKPLYAYVWIFPLAFLPWTLFLPSFVYRAERRSKAGGADDLALPIAWWIVIFLFFSFSSGKRTVYMVPLEPAAAILVGWVLSKFWCNPTSSGAGWGAVAPAAFICTAFLAIGVAALIVNSDVVPLEAFIRELADYPGVLEATLPPAIAAGLCGLAGLVAYLLKRWGLVVAMVAITMPVVGWTGLLTTIPFVNAHKSARIMLNEKIAPLLRSKDDLALFGTRRAGYSFYWDHQMRAIQMGDVEGLMAHLSQPGPASILVKTSFIKGKNEVPELVEMLGTKVHEIWRGRLGGRKLVVIANYQAATPE